MREHGWKHLKTDKNTIALRGNGGVQPLEITDAAVPNELCDIVVRMPADAWQRLLLDGTNPPVFQVLSAEPANARIREALRMPCVECNSYGTKDGEKDSPTCPACHGSGTQQVPGARLLPRGEHIECR